jgi:hypothetical protein
VPPFLHHSKLPTKNDRIIALVELPKN